MKIITIQLSIILIFLGISVKGADTLATINSFEKENEFWVMDYSGDYQDVLDNVNRIMIQWGSDPSSNFKCSLFTARGDAISPLMGRNFDNPLCDVMVARFTPTDGYHSVAFTRMSDLGFPAGTNFENLTYEQKIPLVNSPYWPPDGINEHGLSAGLAYIEPGTVNIDDTKDTIFVTRLIREILDHSLTVEEALEVANSYNVFDNNIYTLSHHVHVSDSTGASAVLEYNGGSWHAVTYTQAWQTCTNIPVYGFTIEQLRGLCWRFNSLWDYLEGKNGNITWQEGFDALESVALTSQWSAIYDPLRKGAFVSIYENYEDIALVPVDSFSVLNYGHFYLNGLDVEDENQNGILEPGETISISPGISSIFDSYEVTGVLSTDCEELELLNNTEDFGTLYKNDTVTPDLPYQLILDENIEPQNIAFELLLTTSYGYDYTIPLTLFAGIGDVLIVDDDEGMGYEHYYIDALDDLGIKGQPYNIALYGDIEESLIERFNTVIWYTGDASQNTLTFNDQVMLVNHLIDGGNLFLTGQHIGSDIGGSDFYSGFLHAELIDDDWTGSILYGVEGDPIGGESMISIIGNGGANNQDSPGIIAPLGDALPSYYFPSDESNISAIHYSGNYKVVYFEFGFEAVNQTSSGFISRAELMERILNFFEIYTGKEPPYDSEADGMKLYSNYPNPFDESTTIIFEILDPGHVALTIYDLNGKMIKELLDKKLEAGLHQIVWDGKDQQNKAARKGVYFYCLSSDELTEARRMVLLD